MSFGELCVEGACAALRLIPWGSIVSSVGAIGAEHFTEFSLMEKDVIMFKTVFDVFKSNVEIAKSVEQRYGISFCSVRDSAFFISDTTEFLGTLLNGGPLTEAFPLWYRKEVQNRLSFMSAFSEAIQLELTNFGESVRNLKELRDPAARQRELETIVRTFSCAQAAPVPVPKGPIQRRLGRPLLEALTIRRREPEGQEPEEPADFPSFG